MGYGKGRDLGMKEAERLAKKLLEATQDNSTYEAIEVSEKLTSLLNTYEVGC